MARGIDRILFTCFVGFVLFTALFVAKDWPIRASIIILFLGSIGVVLLFVQLVLDVKTLKGKGAEPERLTYDVAAFEHEGRWGSLEIWAWLMGLFIAIHAIGFTLALPLFVFLYAKIYGSHWVTACILAAGTWGFLEGVFEELLHVPWPEPWIRLPFGL
jgi:hypothetical protein